MKNKQLKQQKLQKPKKPSTNNDTNELTFLEHIYELRSRLFWIVATIILASAAGFQFKDQLISVVMDPLHGQKLVYLTPGGGFGFIFTLAIYFGVLMAIPVIVYHVYRFLQPLLSKTSKKLVATFMLLSCLLAAGGAAFGYFVTIPAALDFLATFAGDAVIPNLTAESYLNFVVAYILGLALLFQLPLLLFLFDHVRPFPPGSLLSSQRYVIIGSTVIAAIITPTPDAFNMAIVAVPIVVIYQLGVIAVAIRHRVLRRAKNKVQRALATAAVPAEEQPLTEVLKETEGKHSESTPGREPEEHLVDNRDFHVQAAERESLVTSRTTQSTQSVQTIDGVVRTRGPQPVVVPLRVVAAQRLAESRSQYQRPVRSVDGLSMLGYSTNP